MGSATKRLEKQVGEVSREITGLNERFGGLGQILSTVKELMMEIKEALARREEGGKSPLVQSLNKASLGMPVFSGEDPFGWIFKAERYFMLYGIEEREKVAYAALHMEGKALNWLMWMEARNSIHGWEMFKHGLMERFQTIKRVSTYKQLLSLRQRTTVERYREQFEFLSAPIIRDMSEEMMIRAFINGLNDVIKAGLKSMELCNLAHVMSLAQEIEVKLKILKRLVELKLTETGRSTMEVSRGSSMSKTVSKPKEMGGTGSKKGGVKKMTGAEFKFRMEMSLCFLCDEDYSENHDCINKHLQLILVDDDDEDETDEEEEQETVMEEIQNALPMKSTVANDSADFKFRGKIGSKEVIVKISLGATHNFISKEVVAELQLPMERTRSFRVNFGFGVKAEGAEICRNVVLKAQGIEIAANFFPTNLRIADVMLGFEWLRSVGAIFSFEESRETMTFTWHGRTITLQPDPSLTEGIELGLMILESDEED